MLKNKKDPEKEKIVIASSSNNQKTALTRKIDQEYQSDSSEAEGEVFEDSLNTTNRMTEHKLHPEEIKSLIPLFDDTDMSVDIWIRKIKALQTSLQWSSALTLLYATSRLAGIPELWFSDVAVTTFDDFEEKITEEFKRKVSLAEVHSNLRLMAKKKDETMYYFAYRVRKYAKQFDVDDKDVVTYVVNGLASESIYSSISLLRFKDFKDLVEVLKTHEANQKLRAQSKPVMEEEKSYQPRCYNCNEVGHIALKCDKPLKRKCEKCGSTGHSKETCKREETEKPKIVHVIQEIATSSVICQTPDRRWN